MSDVNTAEEQQVSPIGALYPYLQHRKPECTESCVCGARDAVLAVEQGIREREPGHQSQPAEAPEPPAGITEPASRGRPVDPADEAVLWYWETERDG